MSALRPAFLTPAMWFAWLLREDARAGAAVEDAAAQQDFVAWWLLFGAAEYPAAWSYGPLQVEVAMQSVTMAGGLVLPRLLQRLHRARRDLQLAFPLDSARAVTGYLCWYRIFGPMELACAPPLGATELALTEEIDPGCDLPRMAVALGGALPALRARNDWSDPTRRRQYRLWYQAYGAALLPAPSATPVSLPGPALVQRSAGVNLIGFARARSGLGEDVRGYAKALAACRRPHRIVDVQSGAPAACLRGIGLFCMSAFDMGCLLLARGRGFFAGGICIGCWPWELPEFPALWDDILDLVQEIWVPSAFVARAYAARGKPVFVVPPCVSVPAALRVGRRGHRSQESAPYRFIYPFDIHSSLARKNPQALVRAFAAAFPADDRSVSLVLRVNGTDEPPAALAAAGADPRVLVLPGSLTRAQALGVLAACDCLVSPHRAEGFGRNIAEALLLGVEVLATGFSGCLEFLDPDECLAWSPRLVAEGEYPFGAGFWWAEPDFDDLVARLRAVRARPKTPAQRARRAAALRERHSPGVVGRIIAARLEAIA